MVKRISPLFAAITLSAGLWASGMQGAAAQVGNHVFRISAANSETHPQNQGGIKFAELVEKKSGGKMTVKIFSNGVLGNDLQSLSGLQGGILDMMIGTLNNMGGSVKENLVLEFPFMFKSAEEADFIMDGPIGDKLKDKMADKGVITLSFFELGFRHFHTRKGHPIRTADDFKGQKLRVQTTAVYVNLVNALGANATPMGFSQTFSALETGAIDGMSNPLINVLDGRYYEVSQYLAITNHVYQPSFLAMSKKVWDRLTADEKKILQEAGAEASVYQRKVSREVNARALDELKAKKMEVTVLPPAELDKMRERLKPVIEKHTQLIGPAFVAEVMSELEKYRGTHK
ncbi:DctP family TRAP transporter solute-binding subunit [Propionivibrio sp.]|uniref:DctP family TRAP transporter solute-binding subunit n=1 Tax=Propionivibrio sp. TaxID=2212460 RepID=UPI0039E291EC